jgi:UDP-2,3-diacylglucosamine pyrophosphatase LpxH
MKIFLSDLHLSDGKERDDFQYHKEFNETVKKWVEEFKKVEIILLGDIFDLIRTQKYYEFEGAPRSEVKLKVMADIVEHHSSFFETLKYFVEQAGCTLRYIIGNHDFGAYLQPGLLKMIQDKHGVTLTPELYYLDKELKIWAEHGHRYDCINNTFNKDGTPIEYSVGDRIVIEIVDKFFEKVRKKQGELGINSEIINDLDNVRPQSAITNWLDSKDEEGRLRQMYYDTITSFIFSNAGGIANLALEFIQGKYQPDLLKAAKGLVQQEMGKFIIFGHTHDALKKDLRKGSKHLNTGTWRKFIEPGRRFPKRVLVPSYREGGTQFYEEQVVYRYTFKENTHLSYVMFYEKGEGKTGPRLVEHKQEG